MTPWHVTGGIALLFIVDDAALNVPICDMFCYLRALSRRRSSDWPKRRPAKCRPRKYSDVMRLFQVHSRTRMNIEPRGP
jgi:hypothetical protein